MVGWSKFIKLIGEERFSTDLAAQLINPNALGGEDDKPKEDDAGGTDHEDAAGTATDDASGTAHDDAGGTAQWP